MRFKIGMFFCFLPVSFISMASSCSSRFADESDSLAAAVLVVAALVVDSVMPDTDAGTVHALFGLAGVGVACGAM